MKEVIKKINFKELIICILIPFIIGGLFSFLSGDISSIYEEFNKPFFAPPRIIFPIVWSIIYFLLGISSYIVYQTIKDDKNDMDNKKIFIVYFLQLLINATYTIILFRFKLYFISFLWTLLLIFVLIVMISEFYEKNKLSAYLQIPYFIWCIFAAILNVFICKLN